MNYKNLINNERGLTLIQILFAVAVLIVLTTLTASLIISTNEKKEESVITANVSQLEASSKSYFVGKNSYPVKESEKLSSHTNGTATKKFFDTMVSTSGFSKETVDNRIKVVDVTLLKSENFLSADITNPEEYVLDKKTGKVYHIGRDAKLEEIKETVKKLISDAGDIIELKKNTEIVLEKEGKQMTKVISTVTQGNKMVLGGDGSMKVAVVTLSESKDKVSNEITDLTGKLTGPAPEAVTELVLVDTNKVLVHYFDGKELAYKTLDF